MYHEPGVGLSTIVRMQPLLRAQSPYQRIEFDMTNRGLGLFLNDEMQFVEQYERQYHHALAGIPMQMNHRARHVLILGGGDGLAARTVFEWNPNTQVTLAELDPIVLKVCATYPPAVRLNSGALSRTTSMVGDAQKTIRLIPDTSVDVVLADFPDQNSRTMSLYDSLLYSEIYRVLKPGGIVSAYAGGDMIPVDDIIHSQFGNAQTIGVPISRNINCCIVQGVKQCLV